MTWHHAFIHTTETFTINLHFLLNMISWATEAAQDHRKHMSQTKQELTAVFQPYFSRLQ